MKKAIVYAYTMTDDTGFAPAVDSGLFSLACCKPDIRFKIGANYNDSYESESYIIGICGKGLAERNNLPEKDFPVYIAKITEAVTTEEYFSNEKYKNRPDAQYIFKDNTWYTKPTNRHNEDVNAKENQIIEAKHNNDLYNTRKKVPTLNYVLLSTEYIYFGKDFDSKKNVIPECLEKIIELRKGKRGGSAGFELTNDENIAVSKYVNLHSNEYKEPNNIEK